MKATVLVDSFTKTVLDVQPTAKWRHDTAVGRKSPAFRRATCSVWPWIDKDEQIPKSEYPPMVSGYMGMAS